jgi:hydrogenase/urease accessory protein HupE
MIRIRRISQIVSLILVSPALALAHPGHEGHELTWDLNHLAAHPLATLYCLAIVAAGAWCAWRVALWGGLTPTTAIRSDSDR